MLTIYFHDSGVLRSTHPVPLSRESIDAVERKLLLACNHGNTDEQLCNEYSFHTWDFVSSNKPYLMVAGLLYFGNKKSMEVLIAAEDASVMYAVEEKSRRVIFGFGALFSMLGAVLGYIASGAIVRPVERLTSELARTADISA